jgi:hypothetical protein
MKIALFGDGTWSNSAMLAGAESSAVFRTILWTELWDGQCSRCAVPALLAAAASANP